MRRKDLDSLIRRSRDLVSVVAEHAPQGPVEEVVAGLVCNGCGKTVLVRAGSRESLIESLPSAAEGWRITQRPVDEDLCPECAIRAEAA